MYEFDYSGWTLPPWLAAVLPPLSTGAGVGLLLLEAAEWVHRGSPPLSLSL